MKKIILSLLVALMATTGAWADNYFYVEVSGTSATLKYGDPGVAWASIPSYEDGSWYNASSAWESVTTLTVDASCATHNATNLSYLFGNFTKVTSLNGLENLKTAGVTNISGMFMALPLAELDLSTFNTTSATNTVFTRYYGAGNGGTNYVQYDNTDTPDPPYSDARWQGIVDDHYHPTHYLDGDKGYEADYDFEVINTSTGTTAGQVVNRSYYYSAQFATTNTGNVTSTLTNCIVKKNFYGGGFLGGVSGNVTSTLTDTRVFGSAFGAGYSASVDTVVIHGNDKNPPVANIYTGLITYTPNGTSNTYTWTNDPSLSPSHPISSDNKFFFTEVSVDHLGAVSDNVIFTIQGKSSIGTFENGVLKSGTGNVFGCGDESTVDGNTLVKVLDQTKVFGNIYGGGNMGEIGGDTKVIINGVTPQP